MKAITHTLAGSGLALFGLMAGAQDVPSKEIALDIKPQPMVDALNGWAQQTGFQIIVPDECAANKLDAPRVRGTLTAQAALSRLLAGTPLTYEFVNERTVAIQERIAGAGPASSPAAGKQVDKFDKQFLRVAAAQVEEVLRVRGGGAAESEGRSSAAADAREAENKTRRGGVLEEIIVTAQKREERLQDVPISMSVMRGDDLDRATVQGMNEALSRVPGVSIQEFFLGGGAQVPIRGVAAGLALFTGSSPTAYYLDSVPFGFVKTAIGPDPDVYDLERVEVLRGPQGTLYGASALNGVVRVLTRDANVDEFELKARGLSSNTQDGEWNYRGDVAVNVPIVEGKLATRAIIGYQDLSGWIDRANDKNANDAERLNMRLKVNAEPTDQLSVGLSAWLSRSDFGAPSTGNDNGQHPSLFDEPISTGYDAYGLKIGYDFPGFSITSMTSYLDYANDSLLDIAVGVPRPNILGIQTNIEARTFAQELILSSTHEGSWRWSLGGMYRDSEDRLHQFIDGVHVPPGIKLRQLSESYATFGELTRIFPGHQLELTVGLRYFEDDVAQREDSRFPFVPLEQLVSSDSKFDALSPRVALTWHANQQMTAYASYSEGFRSGSHQNPSVLAVVPLPPVGPDTLKNYEVGAKGNLWDGFINFDTALYYIDWQDVQQSLVVLIQGIGFTAIVNSESASGMGFEFAATATPSDALTVGASFSWNDLTVDNDVVSGGVVLFDKGGRLAFSPEYTAAASADYVFPLGTNGLEGHLSASTNYTSKQLFPRVVAGIRDLKVSDSILFTRASFSVVAPAGWTATIFVDNLNNEDGSPTKGPFPHWDVRVRPRTIGFQLEYRH